MSRPAPSEFPASADAPLPRQFGDYRLLREVGRGGMGVVYEAEQQALGRRVALKLLPAHFNHGPFRERFQREARAAARLHHSNIVPVFGSGEHEGTPFYVMQFIDGRGLDAVLQDVKTARQQMDLTATTTFLGGRLPEPGSLHLWKPSTPTSPAAFASPVARNSAEEKPVLPGPPETSYFRQVARLGIQAAEALAYAHGRRVLHRDVKPSNLLLDEQGTLWVADFGLAKANDSPDLTEPGTLLGTLRYLAPERLQGQCDARADIYALGVTLYEMLTLRPAFEGGDRAGMLECVAHQCPSAPRRIDPSIPHDLETIVLKAMAAVPTDRYATADALAEDLRRFLADRPILARRASLVEQFLRWRRRNPVVAVLTSVIAVLLVIVAVGSSVAALLLREALGQAELAQQSMRDHLWESQLKQAHMLRHSRRPGQRLESLRILEEAARYRITPAIRNEVIACLALPDLEEMAGPASRLPDGVTNWTLDLVHRRYAVEDGQGNIRLRRFEDDGDSVTIPGLGEPAAEGLRFSPDGRFLVQRTRKDGRLRLWDLASHPPREVLQDRVGPWFTGETPFNRSGRQLAVAHTDRTVSIYDTASGRETVRLDIPTIPPVLGLRLDFIARLAFHDTLLAVHQSRRLRILDVATREMIADLEAPFSAVSLTWHPDGRRLAATANDGRTYLCDLEGKRIVQPRDESLPVGGALTFHPGGDALVGVDGENMLRVWDCVSQRLLFQAPGRSVCYPFGQDLLVARVERGRLRIERLILPTVLRQVSLRGYRVPVRPIGWSIVDPAGRWLATETGKGPILVDLAQFSGPLAGPTAAHSPVCFDARGDLWTATVETLVRWKIKGRTGEACELEQGQEIARGCNVYGRVAAAADARRFLVPLGPFGARLLDRDSPQQSLSLRIQSPIHLAALSPDGRWAVAPSPAGNDSSTGVTVWDVNAAERIRELPCDWVSQLAFSPDGRLLAVRGSRLRLWNVGSWQEAATLEEGAFAFSSDSRRLAVSSAGSVVVYEVDSGKEEFRLEMSDELRPLPQCFAAGDSRLILYGKDTELLYVWNLHALHHELTARGLN